MKAWTRKVVRSDWFLDILPGQTGFTNGLLVGKERKRGLKDDSKSNGGSHVVTPPSPAGFSRCVRDTWSSACPSKESQ